MPDTKHLGYANYLLSNAISQVDWLELARKYMNRER